MAQRPNVDGREVTREEFDKIVAAAISRAVARPELDSRKIWFCLRLDEFFERLYDTAVDLTSRR